MAEFRSLLPPTVRNALVALMSVLVLGTIGFQLAGGSSWSLYDSFYMTIVTITTVGFQEVKPLNPAGRFVAMLTLLFGVGIAYYVFFTLGEFIAQPRVLRSRRMEKKAAQLDSHYIICGFGRVGRAICSELDHLHLDYVVIDIKKDPEPMPKVYITGDATDDAVLKRAGIDRAGGLVAVMGSDPESLYTTIAARQLRPDLRIVARYTEPRAAEKFRAAGATRVINPYQTGGTLMAQSIVHPNVVDFITEVGHRTGQDVLMTEVKVPESSSLVGQTLDESPIRTRYNVIITMIQRGHEKMFVPHADFRIQSGDVLIAMGNVDDIDRMIQDVRVA